MDQGKAYLVHAGDYHTFCGRMVEQTTPLLYRFENVSKIRQTNNGDCWDELAAGDEEKRKACDYRHFKTACELPISIIAVEWVGELPQEWE